MFIKHNEKVKYTLKPLINISFPNEDSTSSGLLPNTWQAGDISQLLPASGKIFFFISLILMHASMHLLCSNGSHPRTLPLHNTRPHSANIHWKETFPRMSVGTITTKATQGVQMWVLRRCLFLWFPKSRTLMGRINETVFLKAMEAFGSLA